MRISKPRKTRGLKPARGEAMVVEAGADGKAHDVLPAPQTYIVYMHGPTSLCLMPENRVYPCARETRGKTLRVGLKTLAKRALTIDWDIMQSP